MLPPPPIYRTIRTVSIRVTFNSVVGPSIPERARRGRPRSDTARRAILEAASALLEERGLRGMSIGEVAVRAGVGKGTIYRWWETKGTLALDAFLADFLRLQPQPDTGSLRGDLLRSLRSWVRAVTTTPAGPTLGELIGEAQRDPKLARAWTAQVVEPLRSYHRVMFERAIARGEISATRDIEVAMDVLYGAAYHRLLHGHRPLDDRFVREVVEYVIAGATSPALGQVQDGSAHVPAAPAPLPVDRSALAVRSADPADPADPAAGAVQSP